MSYAHNLFIMEKRKMKKIFFMFLATAITISACGTLNVQLEQTPTFAADENNSAIECGHITVHDLFHGDWFGVHVDRNVTADKTQFIFGTSNLQFIHCLVFLFTQRWIGKLFLG